MPQLRDFLSRFRPAGAPGSATRAGVPADRSTELAAEVGPVLALLDGAQAECAGIIEQARHDADTITAAARAQAAVIAADGDRRARAARAEAARQLMALASNDAVAMVVLAEQQAALIRERSAQRMPAMVQLAVGQIRELLAEER